MLIATWNRSRSPRSGCSGSRHRESKLLSVTTHLRSESARRRRCRHARARSARATDRRRRALMNPPLAQFHLGGINVGAIAFWIDERVHRVLRSFTRDELAVPAPLPCVVRNPDVGMQSPQYAHAPLAVGG